MDPTRGRIDSPVTTWGIQLRPTKFDGLNEEFVVCR